ncbi:hypothetical protein MRB53_040336 [Persea americana]|nr:hypothetical protein MRB53_040336 [Persea americana]
MCMHNAVCESDGVSLWPETPSHSSPVGRVAHSRAQRVACDCIMHLASFIVSREPCPVPQVLSFVLLVSQLCMDHDTGSTFERASSTRNETSPEQQEKTNGTKRKRKSGLKDNGSETHDEDDHHEESKPATKRACNECRQQKQCSRCTRLKLDCRIDANFRRIGKRSKNAEMEREIIELRRRLVERDNTAGILSNQNLSALGVVNGHIDISHQPLSAIDQGVAGSLLDLRRGSDGRRSGYETPKIKRLGSITLSAENVDRLFAQYFRHYHQFMPFLDPKKSPEYYFDASPLLFWAIIVTSSRRDEEDPTLLTGMATPLAQMMWSTVAAVPQNYHVVKALIIMCLWPLPTKSTSTDPTWMIGGLMMQLALQTGLHRPAHYLDFSRIRLELRPEDVKDRLRTWKACNLAMQMLNTGYGQPPRSIYDYNLIVLEPPAEDAEVELESLYWRLQIEKFADRISRRFYNNKHDSIGIASDHERTNWIGVFTSEYEDLSRKVRKRDLRKLRGFCDCASDIFPAIEILHLEAARLHLRLSAFFDAPTAPNYIDDLLQLYIAATNFLDASVSLETASGPALRFSTTYIMQMTLSAGFALLKLMNSFFAHYIDVERTRKLFHKAVWAIRQASVTNNDLPGRLAEVLAQLWRSKGAGMRAQPQAVDDSLQLRVRCRASVSLIFDSICSWREEFLKGDTNNTANLDRAVASNPTDPAAAVEPEGATTQPRQLQPLVLDGDPTHMDARNLIDVPPSMAADVDGLGGAGYPDYNYEV